MKKITSLYLFSLLLLGACTQDNEQLKDGPIDSIIQIKGKVKSSTGNLVLECRTEKEYNCSNYKIIISKNTGSNNIDISFKAIKVENICATAFGPATTEINLGALDVGEYKLTLNTLDAQNSGVLKVTPTQIFFEFNSLLGIDILTPIVQR